MSYLSFTVCAHCGASHELVSAIGLNNGRSKKPEPRPSDGDKSLCYKCGQWNVFDEGEFGGLRKATAAEIRRLERSKVSRNLFNAWRLMNQKRRLDAAVMITKH